MSLRINIKSHLIGRIFYKLIETINILIIGKIFDEWTLGQYNQYVMQSSLLILMLNMGLGSSVQYFVSQGRLHIQKTSLISFILLMIGLVILNINPSMWHINVNYTLMNFLYFIILYALFGIWQELNYNICLAIKKINVVNIFSLLGPLSILITLLLKQCKVIDLDIKIIIYLLILNQVILGIVASIIVFRHRSSHHVNSIGFSSVISFGFMVYITNVIQFFVYRFDYWILERHDVLEFALFSLSSQMINFLWFLPNKMSDIAFIHSAENEYAMENKIARMAHYLLYGLIALGVGVCVALYIIFFIFDMQNYNASLWYLMLMLLPSSLFGVSILFAAYQSGNRRLRINFWGSFWSCVLAIILSLWLIPLLGVYGAIIECSIVYLFAFVYHFLHFSNYCLDASKIVFLNPLVSIKKLINEEFRFMSWFSRTHID